MSTVDVLIVGSSIFGVAGALELNRRGYNVSVLDSGPVPHPLAASTDISKVIRMEYGPDGQYMKLVEAGLQGWTGTTCGRHAVSRSYFIRPAWSCSAMDRCNRATLSTRAASSS